MKFDFLINIIFSHEYYNECIPSEIFEIEPRRTNRVVLGGPKYPFRQTGRNQYALIGDREELLDHLSTSPDGLNLEFQAHSKDPNFLLYTQSLLPEELNDSDIQLSVIDNRLNRLNVIIHVTKELLKTKCPIQKEIHYHTKEAYLNPAKRKAMVVKNEKRFLKQKRNALKNPGYSRHPVKTQASFKRLLKAV